MRARALPGLGLLLFTTVGCAPPAVDYSELRSAANARQQATGSTPNPPNATVQALLARPMTAETAAQIAVVNNRRVRAAVEELGIAEGRWASVRRLPNPTLEAAMRFDGGERPALEIGAMIDVTELLLLASRSSAASAEVDAAKLAAIGAILDLSFDARRAFYAYQAAAETLELRRTVLQAFNASAELATLLRAAGNITELDLLHQRSLFEEARLEFQQAELEVIAARERLSSLLGLWGRGAEWTAAARLPDPPAAELAIDELERRAIERSLDLMIAKQRFTAAARRSNAAQAQGFLPELKAGVAAEREDVWSVGPAVELEVPLFYQGQGEVGVAKAQMRQQQNLYTDTAVALRALARETASRLAVQRESVGYYKSTLLPLKQSALEQSQLEYNAMVIGLFQLLQAKRDQVQTAVSYVEHLREYWFARTNAQQLLAGRMHATQSGSSPGGGTRSSLPADAH